MEEETANAGTTIQGPACEGCGCTENNACAPDAGGMTCHWDARFRLKKRWVCNRCVRKVKKTDAQKAKGKERAKSNTAEEQAAQTGANDTAATETKPLPAPRGLVYIDIRKLKETDTNFRGTDFWKDAEFEELRQSIQADGVQNPILVREIEEDMYRIIAGHRRVKACLALLEEFGNDRFNTVPAIVKDVDDDGEQQLAILDNLQRVNIHPMREAQGFGRMVKTMGFTEEKLARMIGKPVSYVVQRMALTNLIKQAEWLYEDNIITLAHAMELAKLTQDHQAEAVLWLLGEDHNDPRWLEKSKADLLKEERGDRMDARVQNIHEFREWIVSDIHLDLKVAPFPIDDAELVPTVPACTNCPLNTGYHTNLFPEHAKKACCTDRTCFNVKVAAFGARRRKEVKKLAREAGKMMRCDWCGKRTGTEGIGCHVEGSPLNYNACPKCVKEGKNKKEPKARPTAEPVPREFVYLTTSYQLDRRDPLQVRGLVKSAERVMIITGKKLCPDAKVALWIDGKNKGKEVTICGKGTCPVHHPSEAKSASKTKGGGGSSGKPAKAPTAKELYNDALQAWEFDMEEHVPEALVAQLNRTPPKKLDRVMLEDMYGAFHKQFYNRTFISKFGRLKAKKATEAQLIHGIALGLFDEVLEDADPVEQKKMAERYGLDYEAVRATAEAEYAKAYPKPELKDFEKASAEDDAAAAAAAEAKPKAKTTVKKTKPAKKAKAGKKGGKR